MNRIWIQMWWNWGSSERGYSEGNAVWSRWNIEWTIKPEKYFVDSLLNFWRDFLAESEKADKIKEWRGKIDKRNRETSFIMDEDLYAQTVLPSIKRIWCSSYHYRSLWPEHPLPRITFINLSWRNTKLALFHQFIVRFPWIWYCPGIGNLPPYNMRERKTMGNGGIVFFSSFSTNNLSLSLSLTFTLSPAKYAQLPQLSSSNFPCSSEMSIHWRLSLHSKPFSPSIYSNITQSNSLTLPHSSSST